MDSMCVSIERKLNLNIEAVKLLTRELSMTTFALSLINGLLLKSKGRKAEFPLECCAKHLLKVYATHWRACIPTV